MALEVDNRWKICWDWRVYESKDVPDDEDEDDIVEASLTESDLAISDDGYLSEDEIDLNLLEKLPDPSGGEDNLRKLIRPCPKSQAECCRRLPSKRLVVRRCRLEMKRTMGELALWVVVGRLVYTSMAIQKEDLEKIPGEPAGISTLN